MTKREEPLLNREEKKWEMILQNILALETVRDYSLI